MSLVGAFEPYRPVLPMSVEGETGSDPGIGPVIFIREPRFRFIRLADPEEPPLRRTQACSMSERISRSDVALRRSLLGLP